MEPLYIKKTDKILIIAPHPDDECIGPGGLLLLFKKLCQIMVCTDGSIGQDEFSTDLCKHIRHEEFLNEMKYLGINSQSYQLLNMPDGDLIRCEDCLSQIDFSKFTKIFVTGPNDNHSDHMAAFKFVVKELQKIANDSVELFCYEVHNPMRNPTHYLDISKVLKEKVKLINFHQSQLKDLPYDKYAKVEAEYRALQNRMAGKYIEVYTKFDWRNSCLQKNIQDVELRKFKMFYRALTNWMMMPRSNEVVLWLLKKEIKECIIYGYAELGKILYKCLKKSDIKVKYIIDIKLAGKNNEDGISIVPLQQSEKKDDVVIVTAIYYYDDIKNNLHDYGYDNVVSLYNIIDECR